MHRSFQVTGTWETQGFQQPDDRIVSNEWARKKERVHGVSWRIPFVMREWLVAVGGCPVILR
jgi:hypothetical protein